MPALYELEPGTRFAVPALGLTGELVRRNACRALVKIDRPPERVEFPEADGSWRSFVARRDRLISWSPQVEVEIVRATENRI